MHLNDNYYVLLLPTFLRILSIFLKPSMNFYLKFMHFSKKKKFWAEEIWKCCQRRGIVCHGSNFEFL